MKLLRCINNLVYLIDYLESELCEIKNQLNNEHKKEITEIFIEKENIEKEIQMKIIEIWSSKTKKPNEKLEKWMKKNKIFEKLTKMNNRLMELLILEIKNNLSKKIFDEMKEKININDVNWEYLFEIKKTRFVKECLEIEKEEYKTKFENEEILMIIKKEIEICERIISKNIGYFEKEINNICFKNKLNEEQIKKIKNNVVEFVLK